MTNFDPGLRPDAERVRIIHHIVQRRLRAMPDMSGVEARDMGDISDILGRLEWMLSKYQEKRDLCRMLKGIQDIMLNAAEGITTIDDEMIEMSINSEVAYNTIQNARISTHSAYDTTDRDCVHRILQDTS